jgi:predicted alpha/beta-hydrolase family hydrolase
MLLLPGQSVANRVWLSEFKEALEAGLNRPIQTVEYPWWNNSGLVPNLDQVAASLTAFQPKILIAKSVGTLISVKAILQNSIQPDLIVFIGLPLKAMPKDDACLIQQFLQDCNVPILIIQQADDKLGSFAEIQHFFRGRFVEYQEVSGNDHLYDDYSRMTKLISDFIYQLAITA